MAIDTAQARNDARDALLESLAISRGGSRMRAAAMLIAAAPLVVLFAEPLLLAWLALLVLWNSVLVRPLERRFVAPLIDTNLPLARWRRAAMVFLGLALTQLLPLVAWLEATTFAAVIAATWTLSSATQVFVYYSRDRLLLLAGAAPIIASSLAGPVIFFGGVNLEAIATSLFLLLALAAGGAFVSRSDGLIAKVADEVAARRSAEAASFAKSRFIANMHHELRTPLNAIIGYSEMLRETALEEGRSADAADLDRVLAAAHLQLTMMSDLLAFSELQDGRSQLEVTTFDAARLVQETADALRAEIETNGNALTLDLSGDLDLVRTDGGKLRHCLEHLLANAGRFTRNGAVSVRVRRERNERGDWLVLAVADTGVGIPPERIGAIFEPFTQADESSTRAFDGAGVGLAITSRFARLMGGAVSVESTPGRGSVFTLRVRADLGAAAEIRALASA